ncbi:MAG TPA: inositol monophosphatase [Patescibacteria group bacterium]|nr:inositol monophosphatase [Patescibacteria group bacterium]
MNYKKELQFMEGLAVSAGERLLKYFHKRHTITLKTSFHDFVTEVDIASEKFILSKMRKTFPRYGILSEEAGHSGNQQAFFVVDPLDGTQHFSHGLPGFGILLALVRDGITVASAMYDPLIKSSFTALLGHGSWRNGKRVHCSNTTRFDHALGGIGLNGPRTTLKQKSALFTTLLSEKANFYRYYMNVAWVGVGGLDFYISHGGGPWDHAPQTLFAAEAGAKVTDFSGRPVLWDTKEVVVANPVLHKKLMQILNHTL